MKEKVFYFLINFQYYWFFYKNKPAVKKLNKFYATGPWMKQMNVNPPNYTLSLPIASIPICNI